MPAPSIACFTPSSRARGAGENRAVQLRRLVGATPAADAGETTAGAASHVIAELDVHATTEPAEDPR